MSRIVSKLNLNKTPQLVESNSLIFAKNIKLLKDGSIGQDDSILPLTINQARLTEDINAIITELRSKIEEWQLRIDKLEEQDINADTLEIYKTYIEENPFATLGYIYSSYQYFGGDVPENPTFVLDNDQPSTQIEHEGNNIPEQAAIDFFNNLNGTDHTSLKFPLCPKSLFKHYGQVIFGPSMSFYNNFDYDRYYDEIISLKTSNNVEDNLWFSDNIEEFPDVYPDANLYHVEYNGQVYHIQPLYAWMLSMFLVVHGQKIQKLIDDAIQTETVDDKFIESQIKLLEDKINKATKDIEYYTNSLNVINDINSYNIVGVIPYNTEFYIFLYNESGSSLILKYDEYKGFSICNCNWNYSGGKIDGNCIVNLNGDTLLNVIEYKDDNTLLVPIKTINLTEANNTDDESIYTQIPRINFFNLNFVEYYNNNIPAGTYQFFIRYEIRDNFYTNWFPASKEVCAGTRKVTKTQQGSLQYIDDSIDAGSSFHFQVSKLLYNDSLNFKTFQIGFIIAHDDAVEARAWKKFSLDTTDIYFDYSQEYIEEIDIEDLLNVPYGVFNVKNITVFKNKLYISNYIESDFNPDLRSYADNITVKVNAKAKTTSHNTYYHYPITIDDTTNDTYITEIDNTAISTIVSNLLSNTKEYVDLGNYAKRIYTFKDVTLTITRVSDIEHVSPPDYKYQLWTDINHSDDIYTNDYSDVTDYIIDNLTCVHTDTGVFYKNVPVDPSTGYLVYIKLFKANVSTTTLYEFVFSINTTAIKLDTEIVKVDTTLMPGQEYEYYVHFVKDTGEYTNGYKLNGRTYIDIKDTNNINVLNSVNVILSITNHDIFYPVFTFTGKLPKGYVGCFITLRHTKYKISEIFNITTESVPGPSGTLKAGDNLDLDIRAYTDFDNLKCIKAGISDGVCNYYASQDNTNWITFGSSGKVVAKTGTLPNEPLFIEMNYESNDVYTKLLRITPYIIYTGSYYIYDNVEDLNLYSYICNVRKLNSNYINYVGGTEVYKKSASFETGASTVEDLNESEFENWVGNTTLSDAFYIYSNFNLNYLTVTLDLYPRIVSKSFDSSSSQISNEDNENIGTPTVSRVIRGLIIQLDSINLSDIYELKSMYKEYTRKTYMPYDDKSIIVFDNTVRSSYPQGDESKINVFTFKATDYYNVPTDKGIIVNMKASGEAIVVHTQDSMYKFTGANSLTAAGGEDVAMKEGEPFDTGIQEIFGSEFGFAGIRYKDQHIISENGYIFFDWDAKIVYLYGGQQQAIPLTDDIDKLLHRSDLENIMFANDYYNDRMFIQFIFTDGHFATLSFNFRVKSFISLHDFKFEKSFNTKTKCYFIRDNSIYVITKTNSREYTGLLENDNLYPYYPSFTIEDGEIKNNGNDKSSIVDIIFKEDYSNIKTLNAISWVCNKILGFKSTDNLLSKFVAEESLEHYAGGLVRIYTDSAATDLIEVHKASNPYKLNTVDSYKYPRYNLGQWTLNYFRNILNTNDITKSNSLGDNKSLIYGKYIVVRFIFSNLDNFKLEDINFNIAPYN